jgi:hypothetical protein
MLIPVGSAGLTLHVYGVVPPAAVTGVNAVYAVFTSSTFDPTATLVVSGPFTVRLKGWLDVAAAASVTVTVYVACAAWAVGVPLIAPVVGLRLIPVGNAGLTLQLYGVVPPVAVTGVNAVYAVFTSSTFDPTATAVVRAPFTVRLKLLLDVAVAASVTVTV